jgi:hypothetical protein
MLLGKVRVRGHVLSGGVHQPAEPGLPVAQGMTTSHWATASALVSWAKVVFSMAATAARCFVGACASALRIQCTRGL